MIATSWQSELVHLVAQGRLRAVDVGPGSQLMLAHATACIKWLLRLATRE